MILTDTKQYLPILSNTYPYLAIFKLFFYSSMPVSVCNAFGLMVWTFRSQTFRTRSFSPLTFLVQDVSPPAFLDQDGSPLDILDLDVLHPDILDQDVSPPNFLDLDVSHPGRFAPGHFGHGRFARTLHHKPCNMNL